MRHLPIPRPSRLRAVWLTYRTQLRWWSWPLAMGIVGFLLWGAYLGWQPRVNQLPQIGQEKITEQGPDGTEVVRYVSKIIGHTPVRVFNSGLPSDPASAPHARVRMTDNGSVEGNEPKWNQLRSLTLDRGWASCKPLWTDGALPLLESLVVWNPVQDESIIRLCELYDLKALTLVRAGDLTTTAMEALAREPRLEFLSLDISNSSLGFPPLPGEHPLAVQQRLEKRAKTLQRALAIAWPATLKTLRFYDEPAGTNLARLKEWQQLPHLSCLVTRLTPVEGNQLDDEVVATLQQFPKLKRLYLRDPSQGETNFAIIQQRRLTQLIVRPMQYDPTRGKRAMVIGIGGTVIMLLLQFVLMKQFVTSANRLKPHFARSHLLIPAGVIAVLAITSFFLYRLADCPALVGLGMCAASVAVVAVAVKLFRTLTGVAGLQLLVNPGMWFPAVIVPSVCSQLVLSIYGAEIDWFLRGQYSWWPLVVLVVSVWGVRDMAIWLCELSRELEQGGCANVPLGTLDPAGWAEWGKSVMAAKATGREKTPLAHRRMERRLEQMERDLAAGKKFTQYELWRLAVLMTFVDWMFIMVPAFAAILIPLGLLAYYLDGNPFELGQRSTGSGKIGWPILLQFVMVGLAAPLANLSQRYPMLAIERLRPETRENWTRTWFQGVFWELAPLPVLLLCATVVTHQFGLMLDHSVAGAAILFSMAVGAGSVLVALGMWATTLRSHWCAVGLIVAGAGGGAGLLYILSGIEFGSMSGDSAVAVCMMVTFHAAAFGLWHLAQWRWREWELGLTER